MKGSRLLILVAMVLLCGYSTTADNSDLSGNPMVSGGLSRYLSLTLAFVPKSAGGPECFQITLQNEFTNDLKIAANSKEFQGKIVLTNVGKGEEEFYERHFRTLMLTGLMIEPVQILKKGATLVWKVPVADLCDLFEKPLAMEELNGSSACAKLARVAIVPPDGSYLGSNAKQVSPVITIKARPAGQAP